MATINEINQTIISGTFTNDQLDAIVAAVKFARGQIAQKNKFTLIKGTAVKFVSNRTGQSVQGTVEKVNRKFIIVKTIQGNWRVPANMLSAA